MLERLLAIPTSDVDRRVRGRLLKGTIVLLMVMIILDLPIILAEQPRDNRLVALVGGVLIIAGVVFWLAHRGFIQIGAIILGLAIFSAISFSAEPDRIINTPLVGSYFIPILVVGLVVGANAAFGFGILSLIALFSLANFAASTEWLDVSAVMLLAISALIWVLIRTLEGSLQKAREQRTLAEQSQQLIASREQSLISQKNELEAVYQQQQQLVGTIHELETPVLILGEVLIIPLVGHIDAARSNVIQQRVLSAVHTQQPIGVILDISGLAVVDTAIALNLHQLTQSVRLLGSRVIITGISALVAQTMVALNVELGTTATASSLQDGVQILRRLVAAKT